MRGRFGAVVAAGVVVLTVSCGRKMERAGLAEPTAPAELAKTADFEVTGALALDEAEAMPRAGPAGAPAKKEAGKPKEVRTWKRSERVPNSSALMVGDKEKLPLKGMQVNVRVDGFRARVLLDLYYFNDRDRSLEGTFRLRLPNEASPYYFAFGEEAYEAPDLPPDLPQFMDETRSRGVSLQPPQIAEQRKDTWHNVKEARMVPKEKAAFAYTETVRRRIDPALMEWAGAGVFSARVFPLSPKKLHRIVIGYDVNLLEVGDDLEYRLDLPSGAGEIRVDLSVAELEGVPIVISPEVDGSSIDGRLYYHFEGGKGKDLRTITARLKEPGTIMLVGDDPKTGSYFATRFRPELPEEKARGGSPGAVFLVDTSLSSNPERFNIWLKLMKAILEGNRERLIRFAVLFFNVETFWWQEKFVDNTPGNVAALMKFADGLALEGATDLGTALLEAAKPRWRGVPAGIIMPTDTFLLSDGAPTWGESELNAVTAGLRESLFLRSLFAYTTGLAGTDTKALQFLARETGGAVFSVVGEAEIEKASRAHRSRPWTVGEMGVVRASDLLLAGRPQVVFPGQVLLLVGRGKPVLEKPTVQIALRSLRDLANIGFMPDHLMLSDLTPRIYGEVATGQLEEFADATEEFSRAYACHFRVTGKTCSLLMLESEEDYARFNIKPEEDAFVVKGNPASEIVKKVLAEIGDALSDVKKRFLAWLRKMERMPGVEFKIPTALKMALDRMPRESFEVRPEPLKCRLRRWDQLPGDIQEQLVSKRLDYDDLMKEAERRLADFTPADALKAISSLVENNPGDTVLARDVGFSAMKWGLGGQAYHLFKRVAGSRPYEPQTYHAMANLLAETGRADLAMLYYEVGLAGKWHQRFGEFRKILGLDYLRFLRRVVTGKGEGELKTSVPDFAAARLETVSKEFDLGTPDLVVIITWNTDNSDVDLHVKEPTGEVCYYQNAKTKIGGRITQDVTQGYGPEMYVLPKAKPGVYSIKAHYFAQDQARASARSKVYATVIERWGTPRERVTKRVVTLAEGKEMVDVMTVKVGR